MKVLRQITKEHIQTQGCNKHGTKKRRLTTKTKIKISIHQILHSKKPEKGKIKPKDSRREKTETRAEQNRHKRGRC